MSSPPSFASPAFVCPHCSAIAQQHWGRLYQELLSSADVTQIWNSYVPFGGQSLLALLEKAAKRQGFVRAASMYLSSCQACGAVTVWSGESLLWPTGRQGPPATADMPDEVQELYDEARDVVTGSPRAAAVLLRVALERLVHGLVDGPGSLNSKIGDLVKRGLSPNVQQAMDAARVLGNDGAHVGQLNADDTQTNADTLFTLINIIVRQMIAEPADIAKIYGSLPAEKRAAIERRDQSQ